MTETSNDTGDDGEYVDKAVNRDLHDAQPVPPDEFDEADEEDERRRHAREDDTA